MLTGHEFDKGMRKAEDEYKKAESEGYNFWGSYNTRPEAKYAVRNLRRWGAKVKVIKYPTGVTIVMQKEGHRR